LLNFPIQNAVPVPSRSFQWAGNGLFIESGTISRSAALHRSQRELE